MAFHIRKCAALHGNCTGDEAVVKWSWNAVQPHSIVHMAMAQMALLIRDGHRQDQVTLMHA